VRVPAEQKLTDYLLSGWIDKVDPRSVEDATINGFAAATGIAKGEQWAFRLYVLRFGSDVYRFVFAAKQKTPETDRAFRDSVNSFRRMSVAEIEKAQPLRLKSVTVAPHDTIEKLASRMATDKPVERFLVLNGLTAGQTLKPGEQVKIVTE
jgi:predicted Zn-dependent protease